MPHVHKNWNPLEFKWMITYTKGFSYEGNCEGYYEKDIWDQWFVGFKSMSSQHYEKLWPL
jgi:hypothetical protein